MIAADFGDIRFQLRAAAAIVRDGRLLVHRAEDDAFWALPGGRVEPGEDASATVVRELAEETGAAVIVERFIATVETFFVNRGRRWHEIGLYFGCRVAAGASLPATEFEARDGAVKLQFRWVALDALHGVDLRPQGLATLLAAPPAPPAHWVQRDVQLPDG